MRLLPAQSTFRVLLGIVFGLTIIHAVVWYVVAYRQNGPLLLYHLFNLESELNIPTVYAAFLFGFSALLLFRIGHRLFMSQAARAYYWTLLGAVFVVFTIDELFQLHERSVTALSSGSNAGGAFFSSWVVFGIVLCLVLALVLLDFLIRLPGNIRRQMLVAAALFIGGALVLEMLAGVYSTHITSTAVTVLWYKVITSLEEVLEMLGLVLFIRVLLHVRDTMLSPEQ